MAKIGILGAGSWGIALAALLYRNGHEVCIWSPFQEEILLLEKDREYQAKLPGVKIPREMGLTWELKAAAAGKDLLILAVPSQTIRSTARLLRGTMPEGQILLIVSKGIEEQTLLTLSEVVKEELPGAEAAVMSGPSHAEEVGKGIPTSIVVGAERRKTAEYIQDLFMNETFRVYISPDVLGMELGGALKNVVALAAGIADGLGYGDNAKAALITRGIMEISRLGTAMGGKYETFCGLTGIGDLIVTCASVHSRNRRAGMLIGQGYHAQEAMKEVNMVVEGVFSAKAAIRLAERYQVQLPIIEQVNLVLFEGKAAEQAVRDLMVRDRKTEISHLAWEEG
ncbi:MAG: NAD(P)-dependent glycerol-3-phosphate dehydrogenase [Clostridium sp.]|jgi:glycerol-3-phosphate dehydrogenase (NAD(P)+)|nr:NAD(P)-dependent glycerol-3-phosphate dehydrogenase [Clostridium sp.]